MNHKTLKAISYYGVALASFFFLSWAAADILSAGINMIFVGTWGGGMPSKTRGGLPPPEGAPPLDAPYDSIYRQMVLDRLGDSGARLIISGAVFLIARRKIKNLAGKESTV